jgi:hypothetical protein
MHVEFADAAIAAFARELIIDERCDRRIVEPRGAVGTTIGTATLSRSADAACVLQPQRDPRAYENYLDRVLPSR